MEKRSRQGRRSPRRPGMWRSRVTVISCEGAGICGCAASRHAEPRRFIDSGRGNFRMRIVWTGCADAAGHCGTFWWLTLNEGAARAFCAVPLACRVGRHWGQTMDYHLLTRRCDGNCDWCECPPPKDNPWLPMETAPKDGAEIEILFRHTNWNYAAGLDRDDWQQVCKAHWIDFNGGGWVWDGICGQPICWRALPANAKLTGLSEIG